MPSLHVGLAFAIGIAAATALRRPWTKALALMWGPLVTLSVIATGNHYLFDAAAGLLVTGLACLHAHATCSAKCTPPPPAPTAAPAPPAAGEELTDMTPKLTAAVGPFPAIERTAHRHPRAGPPPASRRRHRPPILSPHEIGGSRAGRGHSRRRAVVGARGRPARLSDGCPQDRRMVA